MGESDMYPFVLAPAVMRKLRFLGRLIEDRTTVTAP
jgi:hypothetical protein